MAENPFPWEDGTSSLPPLPGTPAQPPQAQPAYGQSPYGQPAYGQPAYGQPPYAQPSARQPAPELSELDSMLPPLEPVAPVSAPRTLDEDQEEDADGIHAPRANPWLFWLVPAVLLVVTGIGAVVFVVVRAGPKKADAGPQGPPEWTQPLPDLPKIPTGGQGNSPEAPRGRRSDRPAAPVNVPRVDDLDQSIRLIRQLAETQGAKFRGGKTAARVLEGGLPRQPIEIELAATFPQVVAYLQRLHESLPHVRPVTLELSAESPSPADASPPLPAALTLDCYFSAAAATKTKRTEAVVLPRQPELAPALAQVAKAASHRVALVKMSVATAPDPDAPTYVEPTVTLEALAADEEDVGRFVGLLSRADRLADVKLVGEGDVEVAGRLFRKCTVRLVVTDAPEGAPVPLNAAVAPPQDVFRFAKAFHEKALPAPVKAPEPSRSAGPIGIPAFDPADLVTSEYSSGLIEAKRLHLQSTMPGSKACMINGRVLRVGDRFDSFTLTDVGAGAATVRRGEHTYDIKMRR